MWSETARAVEGVRRWSTVGPISDLGNQVFNISSTIPPDSWYGTLLKGIVNFQPDPSWLQAIGWSAYLLIVLPLYLRGSGALFRRPSTVSA